MEVVYLFHESDKVRIPFFDYDEPLFRLLVSRGGGIWDKARQEFVFGRDLRAEKLFEKNPDLPIVEVDEASPVPLRIFGFLEQPLEEIVNNFSREEFPGLSKTNIPMSRQLPTPQKFSQYWQAKLETDLRSRKYSKCTQRTYLFFNRLICTILQKTPEEINQEDITQFLAHIEKSRDYSSSSLNLAISSIKFFFREVMKKDVLSEQYRPHQDKKLPVVLSKTEINKILNSENNIKHRLLLMLVYSSGLRVSEVVALKREHVDLSRRIIHVRLGKGRKDRYTILSEKAACFISEYYVLYNIQTWLFPGQPPAHPLSIRSAQKIFDNAVIRAEIHKDISIHSLRHTFATHLLENGTDIRYIQALLGHSSLRTTERYTHIAHGNILRIQSPLDTILPYTSREEQVDTKVWN